MYDYFTDDAKRCMQLADQEAQCFNHDYIGTEYMILGIIKEQKNDACKVLQGIDIDLRRIRLEVEKLVQTGPPEMIVMGVLPTTPLANRVIEMAGQEAKSMNQQWIEPLHLLIALYKIQEGVAYQVLHSLGVTLEKIYQESERLKQLDQLGSSDRTSVTKLTVKCEFKETVGYDCSFRTHRILGLAIDAANRFRHEFVGTEHLLLGIQTDVGSLAHAILNTLLVNVNKVSEELTKILQTGSQVIQGKLPQTPRFQSVLKHAERISKELDHGRISSLHLLLGLFEVHEGVAYQVLTQKFGINKESVKDQFYKLEPDGRLGTWETVLKVTEPSGRNPGMVTANGMSLHECWMALHMWIDKNCNEKSSYLKPIYEQAEIGQRATLYYS